MASNNVQNFTVVGGHQAYRPIGAVHNAVGAKSVQHDIDIRFQLIGRPIFVVRLGHHTRDFAVYVFMFGNGLHHGGPSAKESIFDIGFGDVVDDEFLIREFLHKLKNSTQLVRKNEDVVGMSVFLQLCDPTGKFRTQ